VVLVVILSAGAVGAGPPTCDRDRAGRRRSEYPLCRLSPRDNVVVIN